MRFVFASYVVTKTYNDPEAWLNRIKIYIGILAPLAIDNEVISIEQIAYKGECFKDGVNYKFERFASPAFYSLLKVNRYIKQLQPDVVFIQSLHFPLQVILLRFILGNKPKIIIQNHAEKPFSGIKKYLQRLAENAVNAYLFASKNMGLDWITKGNLTSPEKIHEVMEVSSVFYPINKEEALLKTKAKGDPVFLWVGRLDQNKDPLNVIKTFLKFLVINPNARLFMIYHTEELLDEINTLLAHEPNAAAIKLLGKVPHDELLYWYNSACFIISGSHYEGSGTAVCEAMSCGCIPVVTDIFSFRMITDNGNIGLLYEAGNETALLAALIQTQQINLKKQREKALAYFKSNLSFEAIAKQIQVIAASL
ncbi:glycosyltransferase family 4 protein [Mucilaginibacter sp.]|uniref:glycosyltransferase family 4 protein n=1 Tax=Mucilaginibacter sp. TaxID=1882438 RepID=UPI00261247A6|nr:glycosyltransferase family 4 protein [Mucilaginibacter sp.]MDB4925548.1 glycosyltransferase [Mucilaginibacter sp.]